MYYLRSSNNFYFAQTTVFAYVKDTQGNPVENAEIDLKQSDNDVTADKIGYFQLVDMKPGHYQIIVTKSTYETKVIDFDVTNEKKKDLGVISIASTLTNAELGLSIIDSNGNSSEEGSSNQTSTVGLLQSSRDVFNSIASYDLGAYWFRPRGLDGRSGTMMLNGVSMSGGDDGNVDYNNWGA